MNIYLIGIFLYKSIGRLGGPNENMSREAWRVIMRCYFLITGTSMGTIASLGMSLVLLCAQICIISAKKGAESHVLVTFQASHALYGDEINTLNPNGTALYNTSH
jgi:hypothetical protein